MTDKATTNNDQFEGVKDAARLRSEEVTLTKIIRSKMTAQECLRESDREALAYRISEIFVAAKELYTKELPIMTRELKENETQDMFSELAGIRMAFFHIRDLVTDFDDVFMDAMTHIREDDEEEEEDEQESEDKSEEE